MSEEATRHLTAESELADLRLDLERLAAHRRRDEPRGPAVK